MSELQLGVIVALVTVAVLLTGTPIAFGLGIVAMGFLVWSEGLHALGFVPDILYGSLDSFALLSIPMFILMGGAIASSRAGPDLYEALDRWLHRVPGGLLASNSRRLRHLRRALRLVARHLRCDRQDGRAGDAQARLPGGRRHRLDLRRRHARHPDPALDHPDRLRHRH